MVSAIWPVPTGSVSNETHAGALRQRTRAAQGAGQPVRRDVRGGAEEFGRAHGSQRLLGRRKDQWLEPFSLQAGGGGRSQRCGQPGTR